MNISKHVFALSHKTPNGTIKYISKQS